MYIFKLYTVSRNCIKFQETSAAAVTTTSMTNTTGKLTMMLAVAKKKSDPGKLKGELMEANMDAMEVT